MSIRGLVRNYLLEAAAQAGADTDNQVAWLESKRQALTAEVESGDWEVSATAFEGTSQTSRRNLTAHDRLSAVISALDQLRGTGPGPGGIMIPRFDRIPI